MSVFPCKASLSSKAHHSFSRVILIHDIHYEPELEQKDRRSPAGGSPAPSLNPPDDISVFASHRHSHRISSWRDEPGARRCSPTVMHVMTPGLHRKPPVDIPAVCHRPLSTTRHGPARHDTTVATVAAKPRSSLSGHSRLTSAYATRRA